MNPGDAQGLCGVFGRLLRASLLLLIAAPAFGNDVLPPLNNPPVSDRLPGKFTWFDLASPAPQEQMDFYASLFGWTFRAPATTEDGYRLILNGGRAIGGLFEFTPPGGEQDGAIWISLVSVGDADRASEIVTANGGQIESRAVHVPQRGRHALFRDPAGALFGVLQSDSGDPPDREIEIGSFLWVDLFARQPREMADFYSKLAPYTVEERPVNDAVSRMLLSAHGMPRASIVTVDEEANRSAWVPYVRVADVEATLEKVVEGGGFAIVAPDAEILDGNLAVFVDPNGAVMGIVKWDYEMEDAQ